MTPHGWVGRFRVLSLIAVVVAAGAGCGGGLIGPRDEGQVIVTEPEKVTATKPAPKPATPAAAATPAAEPAH
jgi:hypothetical protein